jgi:hypothetical protein
LAGLTPKLAAFNYPLFMNKVLAFSRYAVFIPALASILGALLLMFQGSVAMIVAVMDVVTERT